MSTPLLQTKGVRHQYRGAGPAWRIPDLELHAGQTVACVGPSGSGKTTLLELLAGLQAPRSGEVLIQGQSWASLSAGERQALRLQSVGVVFQGFELLEALTARENVELPLRLSGQRPSVTGPAAAAWLDRARIAELADRKPSKLSHGERQRVAVCRALVHKPKLILADEPTANLDQENAEQIFELLQHAADQEGGAFVCVTHDPALMERLSLRWSSADFMEGARA